MAHNAPYFLLFVWMLLGGVVPLHGQSMSSCYDGDNWLSLPETKLLKSCSRLYKMEGYYFQGTTVLGEETLTVYRQSRPAPSLLWNAFFIFRGRVVLVEQCVRVGSPEGKALHQALTKKVVTEGSMAALQWLNYQKGGVRARGAMRRAGKKVVVVAWGEFCGEKGSAWCRVRLFEKTFFDYRNQRLFWPYHFGVERILLR